ncbi:MAG: GNAT family N-acetyltransferase [Dehalococcoidia bacterium]
MTRRVLDLAGFDLADEILRTERLDLIPLSLEFCEAIVEGERGRAARLLGHPIGPAPGSWPDGDELEYAFPPYVRRLREDPSVAAWQGRAVVLRATGAVLGSVNLKGRPVNGRAEVGYGLVESAPGRGPATREVVAIIDPSNRPSIRVAESLGLRRTSELSTAHPGSYTWVIARSRFEAVDAAIDER